jgi:hypothetical protein
LAGCLRTAPRRRADHRERAKGRNREIGSDSCHSLRLSRLRRFAFSRSIPVNSQEPREPFFRIRRASTPAASRTCPETG